MNQIDPKSKFSTVALASAVDLIAQPPARPQLSEQAREIAAGFSERSVSPRLLSGLTRLTEFVAILLIGLVVHAIYVMPIDGFDGRYVMPLLGGAILTVVLTQAADGYGIPALRTYVAQLGRIFGSWTLVFAFFAVVAFFAKAGDSYSRVFFATWYVAGLGFLFVFRVALASFVRRWTREGRLQRRAVIVGGGKSAEDLIHELESQPGSDIRICGVFDDRSDDRSPAIVAGYPKIGNVAELVEFARIARIDMLIVTLPITAEKRVLQMLKQLWVLPVDIRLSAHTNKLRFRPRSYSYVGAVPFLDVIDKPIADWDLIAKRAFDLVVSSLLLVLLSPILIGAAIAVKLDSRGPVFFRQKRYGFNNEVIEVLKFRSMFANMADADARRAVTKGDPRVTRVGRFIRKASIDELPQLWDVIRGRLSLVGPRPHAVGSNTDNKLWDEVVDGYFARHRVKPGVTGWAQINGWRGEVDTPEKLKKRVECDLYYIENWSVLFDLTIVLLTPIRLLNTEQAY